MTERHCACQQRHIDTAALLDALAHVAQELRSLSADNAELCQRIARLEKRIARLEKRIENPV